jgi:SAM-dependent methyltransferase
MDHEEVGRYWDENAEVWTELVRAGYDHYRDGPNTPAFLAMLPEIRGLSGLDVGCGEGHNTRLLADRGARSVGTDISGNFGRHAREAEERRPPISATRSRALWSCRSKGRASTSRWPS